MLQARNEILAVMLTHRAPKFMKVNFESNPQSMKVGSLWINAFPSVSF